jgi:hypothetical protein
MDMLLGMVSFELLGLGIAGRDGSAEPQIWRCRLPFRIPTCRKREELTAKRGFCDVVRGSEVGAERDEAGWWNPPHDQDDSVASVLLPITWDGHLLVLGVVRPENWTNDRRLLCYWLSVQAAELNRLGLSH